MEHQFMDRTTKHTILCVDDEKQILSALKRLLRKETFDLLTATNGEEGLKIMASRDIHLVISDHRMPEMSGISFLSKVRETYPDTIRILLTGYTEIDSIKASINEGHVYKFLLNHGTMTTSSRRSEKPLNATTLSGQISLCILC